MRVLMVITDLLAGGAENTALELVRALAPAGHQFTVASVKRATVLKHAFQRAGAAVAGPLARFRFDPLGFCRVARLVRRRRVELTIVVGVPRDGMFYGLLGSAAALRPMPRICWCKSTPGGQTGNFMPRLRAFVALGLIDAVVCTSARQRELLAGLGLPRRKMVVIHNGVDLERFASARPAAPDVPAGKKLLVQLANLMPDKDYQTLLAAAAALARRRDDFHLLLVGRDTDSPRLAGMIRRAGAEAVVTAAGHRDDVPEVLARADAFVLSTRSEVFSVAALEAMAAGLPMVVSDIAAFEEMLTPGREALTVPPGDAEALAEAVGRLLDAPALCDRLAAAARQRVRRFSRQRMAENFQRLMARLARTTA